jgi:2-keto-4-pentenoate hydratase
MLTAEKIDQAAQHLFAARKSGTPGERLPESCRPSDADSALAIQERVLELLGDAPGGWKCAVPNPKAPVILSPIPKSGIVRSSPCRVPTSAGQIEPEVAFVLSRDLPARGTPYSEDELRAAIGEAHFVLELLRTSYANKAEASSLEILADSYNNLGLLMGPAIPRALERPLETLHVTITGPDGAIHDRDGRHPSGHPMKAFAWLVQFLNARGQGLKTGEVITTGSYAGLVDVPVGVPLRVQLGDLGVIEVELITGRP